MKKIILLFTLLGFTHFVNAQSVQTATVRYTPSGNGYELDIPFSWKFIDCFGEVYVSISCNATNITSNAYKYNGKRYTASDLGSGAFNKPEWGALNVSANVYDNNYRLGRIKMKSLTDWDLGGCYGQTFHFTEMLGLNDADFKNKLASLSLRNLSIDNVTSRNYTLEGQIKVIEKKEKTTAKLNQAANALNSNNLNEAKRLYQEVLSSDPTNSTAKSKINYINSKIREKKEQERIEKERQLAEERRASERKRAEAERISNSSNTNTPSKVKKAPSNKAINGSFWGKNTKPSSNGSYTQAAHLMGNFRVDYNIWSRSGEPAHKFRFYWEWANASNTGYPIWKSVRGDNILTIKKLQKYPDLMDRWNRIKPEYVEIECYINYFKRNGQDITSTGLGGKIKIIPEVIGYSGREVSWSSPSSSDWDELFSSKPLIQTWFINESGIEDELYAYAKKHGDHIAYTKYAFEYADNMDISKTRAFYVNSEYKDFNSINHKDYTTSATISKIVWPNEEIKAIIDDYRQREKEEKEKRMTTPDSDFWNTPENVAEVSTTNKYNQKDPIVSSWRSELSKRKAKYKALQNPLNVTKSTKNNITKIKGSIDKYFVDINASLYIVINGQKKKVYVDKQGKFDVDITNSRAGGMFIELVTSSYTISKDLSNLENTIEYENNTGGYLILEGIRN